MWGFPSIIGFLLSAGSRVKDKDDNIAVGGNRLEAQKQIPR
jgi:hypothetical protein